MANDFEKDYLIETIRKVLETFFPFLKSHWTLTEEMNEEIKQKEKEKPEEGKHPDDLFTIITFIDSYNFKNSGAYSGEGISLHLIVERKDLEKFVTELETEYRDLRS